MLVDISPTGLIELLLGLHIPDDDKLVIGHSRVAYIVKKDPANLFLVDAAWHDAAYQKGASIQGPGGMTRWEVDMRFLNMMLKTAGDEFSAGRITEEEHYTLEIEAVELFLIVRKYCATMYEGPQK